jgi:transposase
VIEVRKRKFTQQQKDELRRRFHKKRSAKNVFGYRRMQALYLYSKGMKNGEISEICGFCLQYVTDLVSEYLEKGLESILSDNRTTNNRRMSYEAEAEFLEQFRETAEAGQIITVEGILRKYEEATGKSSNTSTIYNLLKRHGWRKVKPRPRHPGAASEEEKNSSKKLTQIGGKSCWKNMSLTQIPAVKKSKALN